MPRALTASERVARIQSQLAAIMLKSLSDERVQAEERRDVAISAMAWAFAELAIGMQADPDQCVSAFHAAYRSIIESQAPIISLN